MGFLKSFSGDDKLVRGMMEGSDECFEDLICKYSTELFNTAYAISGSLRIAEEVISEVFCRAYLEIGSISPKTTVKFWLYGVTVEACLEKIALRRNIDSLNIETIIEEERVVDSDLEPHETMTAKSLVKALKGLPIEYTVSFTLRYVAGLSPRDIVEVLSETTEAAVKNQIKRARALLIKHLSPKLEQNESAKVIPIRAKTDRTLKI